MGLIRAAGDAIGGILADQWREFFTAPTFDEQTLVAPGVLESRGRRGAARMTASNVVTDGSRIAIPENTALVVTDGGRIVALSDEPGYYTFYNDGLPSVLAGSSVYRALILASWERFKFGGHPGQQQLVYFVNLREIRGLRFGTLAPIPYKDFSLVPPGATQAPVLRIRARGAYSVRVVDPVRFFATFLPANVTRYALSDAATSAQLTHELIVTLQAALQNLSRSTDIASLAIHSPDIATALMREHGPGGTWLERFGLEIGSAAVSAIEYDDASRELMDKYNRGTMLAGSVGNAYSQTTLADAAMAAAQNPEGGGMMGVAVGVGAFGSVTSGMKQPVPSAPLFPDPVAVLAQLKTMLDQRLITSEQYAAKQQEVLGRM